MATTYTTNYHLGKQEDGSDKFSMEVITTNMDTIDAQMKANEDSAAAVTPQVKSTAIDNAALALVFSGIVTGSIATEITGGSAATYGVVRAYMVSDTDAMQICETIDGSRLTRYYTSSAWGSWL